MRKETLLKRPLDEWGTSAAQFYARVEHKLVVIHLRGGQTLSVNITYLLEFQRSFKSNRIIKAPA